MSTGRVGAALRVAAFVAAGIASTCAAETADRAATEREEMQLLREDLETLKHQMLSVEAHLKKLEQRHGVTAVTEPAAAQSSAPATAARAPVSAATNAPSARELWGSVADGMTQGEISALLGPPQRTYVLNGKTVWYYSYSGTGPGSIVFNTDQRASSHQTPGFWPW